MKPRRSNIPLSTTLAFMATLAMVFYYLSGSTGVSQTVLLPVAGQVISNGVISVSNMIFGMLVRLSQAREIPLDAITPFLINLDTHFGGFLTPERLVLASFVNLLLLHTPETLLGTLASGKMDLRSVHSRAEDVELGSFGGGFDRKSYYTSGQLLLSSEQPDLAYSEVAYKTHTGWVIPRKPKVFYEVFARNLSRDNDAEKRLSIPKNEAAILVPVSVSDMPASCSRSKVSDFGFWMTFYHCDSYIGFSFGGNLPETSGFYQLHRGEVRAEYSSEDGERVIRGSEPSSMQPYAFPRAEKFWDDMSSCFLNSISFNRPPSDMSWTDRLAISAMVRIAGLENESGFSEPAKVTKAMVNDVMRSNISRWVLVVMSIGVVLSILRSVLSRLHFELLAPELRALVASLKDVKGLTGGTENQDRHVWFHRVWAQFRRDDDGDGGRWIIPDGLNSDDWVASLQEVKVVMD